MGIVSCLLVSNHLDNWVYSIKRVLTHSFQSQQSVKNRLLSRMEDTTASTRSHTSFCDYGSDISLCSSLVTQKISNMNEDNAGDYREAREAFVTAVTTAFTDLSQRFARQRAEEAMEQIRLINADPSATGPLME